MKWEEVLTNLPDEPKEEYWLTKTKWSTPIGLFFLVLSLLMISQLDNQLVMQRVARAGRRVRRELLAEKDLEPCISK